MKKKFLITSAAISLSALLGVGAAVGIMNAKEPVKAEAAVTHKLVVKIEDAVRNEWKASSAKVGVYLWNDNGGGTGVKKDGWTSLDVIGDSAYHVLSYSFDWTPAKMIINRQSSSATSGSWDSDWGGQSKDLDFHEAAWVGGSSAWGTINDAGTWDLTASFRSNLVPSFGEKQSISVDTVGINDSGNPELSGSVTLAENEEFKIIAGDGTWSGFYGCPSQIDNCFTGGSKTERSDQNPNIKCLVAGTYDFFFDTETKKIWLTRQDIVDADGYARYFLENVGCDPTGVALPTGWTACATQYASLNAAAKDYLYAAAADAEGDYIGQALHQYDWAVAHHSTLEKFVKDGSGHVRAVSSFVTDGHYSLFTADSTTTIALITIVAVTSITAIGAIVFLRVRKHQ